MARFKILAPMLTVPRPMAIAEADTPADAVRKAREFEQKGRTDLQIGDTQAEEYFPVAQFAAKHGVR
jgi:hypothetical protein